MLDFLKNFLPKNSDFDLNYSNLERKTISDIGFQEKRHFCRKSLKVAENSDHDNDPKDQF
jgi:hypothetical protein